MQQPTFMQARIAQQYDPAKATKQRRLVDDTDEHRTTVNAYCSWLRKMGVAYEVRLHEQGYYLVKSTGLIEKWRETVNEIQ